MLLDNFPRELDIALEEDLGIYVQCKGGGGGGSSGAVSYPSYMENKHELWLNRLDAQMTAISSPFVGEAAFNPDSDISSMITAVATFSSAIAGLGHLTDWQAAMSTAETQVDTIVDDTHLNNDIAAYAAVLDEDINDSVLPQFKAGMLNVNAVMTSAFVMGEARIWASKTKQINKYASGLRTAMQSERNQMVMKGAEQILAQLQLSVELQKQLLHYTLEAYRLKIVAKKEQTDKDISIAEDDARWEFEEFQYAANMLAGIGGGVGSTGNRNQPSTAQSVMGGALSGAAAGAMIASAAGGPVGWTIGIGAALGGTTGLL